MLELENLHVDPENYDLNIYSQLPEKAIASSLMADCQRRFINGLVRLYKPKRILEIGVAYGGGTCVLLNAINDMPDSKLYSIDIHTKYGDPSVFKGEMMPIACGALDLYGDLRESGKWTLLLDKDPVHRIEDLNERFDFCVIDTWHIHPIETLNFLTILPFLTDGAIVVLDDVLYYHSVATPAFATRILFSSVVGQKLQIKGDSYIENNVAAFQIGADTWKYLNNVFSSLYYPWSVITEDIDALSQFIKRHYDAKYYESFMLSLKFAKSYLVKQYVGIPEQSHALESYNGAAKYSQKSAADEFKLLVHNLLRIKLKTHKKLVFYAAGLNCRNLLRLLKALEINDFLPVEIWDINADRLSDLYDIPVIKPDFSALNDDYGVIITNGDEEIIDSVTVEFKSRDFSNYSSICNDLYQCLEPGAFAFS